jgi:hypothetical protein
MELVVVQMLAGPGGVAVATKRAVLAVLLVFTL